MRIRFILVGLILLLANFVDWIWALEEHPASEIQPVSMELVNQGG